jgi:hypothetical protein
MYGAESVRGGLSKPYPVAHASQSSFSSMNNVDVVEERNCVVIRATIVGPLAL